MSEGGRRGRGAVHSARHRFRALAYAATTEVKTLRFVARIRREIERAGRATLVWQMGRVASQSLNDALLAGGVRPVFHVHWLSSARIAGACERARRHYGYVRPRHLRVSLQLRRILDSPARERVEWRIVTLVRDPVARNVSDYFLALGNYALPGFRERWRRGEVGLEAALNGFLEGYEHDCRDHWFDEEIGGVFGIDLLSAPFDWKKGYGIVAADGVSVLVLRQESLAETLRPALKEWLGLDVAHVPRQHVSGDEADGELYRALLENIRFDKHFLDRMYAIPWVRHFYSPAEIEGFKAKWGSR